MRKLIFLLLLLLIATPCFAQQQEARMSLGVIGGSVPAGGPTALCTTCTGTTGTTMCDDFEDSTNGYLCTWVETKGAGCTITYKNSPTEEVGGCTNINTYDSYLTRSSGSSIGCGIVWDSGGNRATGLFAQASVYFNSIPAWGINTRKHILGITDNDGNLLYGIGIGFNASNEPKWFSLKYPSSGGVEAGTELDAEAPAASTWYVIRVDGYRAGGANTLHSYIDTDNDGVFESSYTDSDGSGIDARKIRIGTTAGTTTDISFEVNNVKTNIGSYPTLCTR